MRTVPRTETWECWFRKPAKERGVAKEAEGSARTCGGDKRMKSENPREEGLKKDEIRQSQNQHGGQVGVSGTST